MHAKVWNILEHGATADGVTLNTDAFESAIRSCADAGGGRVLVPAGTFHTGPIRLRNRVELHLQSGATILFSRNYDDYPLVLTDYEGEPTVRCVSPVSGEELTDVSITGEGVIDGNGDAWRPVKRFKMTDEQWAELLRRGGVVDDRNIWWPTAAALAGERLVAELQRRGDPQIEHYRPARDFLRPNLVKLTRCRNVTLDGPTFQNSPAWNVHLLLCQNVVVRNVRILNPWFSSNGDGLDLDACRNVRVEHSHFDCGDDAICIKSGKDEPGRKRGVACENIDIANCEVVHGHGGVTVGSEMSGGVRNVRVNNCIFRGTDIGLRFKSCRGRGGVVENIEISNVAMHDIRCEAISINLYYAVRDHRAEPVSERTPAFRGMLFRNITCDGAARAIEIRGLPEMPVERVRLDNVRMRAEHGAVIHDARDITLGDVRLSVAKSPAWECHNVSNLRLENVSGFGPVETPRGIVGDL
jgi:polygalacturonase